MPFGLRNAGQTFQRMMDKILAGLDNCFVYLDDILAASRMVEEHEFHLREVLALLQWHRQVLNAEKCAWFQSRVSYLGQKVSFSGIRPLADKVEAIWKFPLPETVQQLQTYLGTVNFYHRFLRGAAQVLKLLTDTLKGGATGKLVWTDCMRGTFESNKAAKVNAAELVHPVEGTELSLEVDASGPTWVQ